MKNLNKFTKAELINKFKKLESKNSDINNSNQSLFSRIVEFILYFKALIFKITLITILVKTIKKYSLFSKILRFANWIILSIFGISIIDNFGLDFFKNFFLEIRIILSAIITYFSNSHFYGFIASLFRTKEAVTNQTVSIREEPVCWESSGNESEIKQSKRNSKISEWLKPEPEVIEERSNSKYYIIAGILIACLGWYYWDEIRTVGPIVTDWFRRPRSGDENSEGSNSGMNRRDIQPSLDNSHTSIQDKIKNIFISNKSDNTPIELIDNTQNIASTSKLDNSPSSDNSMNHYFTKPDAVEPQLTGLKPIIGEDFIGESTAVVQEIDTFLNYHDNSSFPKAVVGAGIYRLLRERLHKLSELNETKYSQLINSDEINDKVNRFIDLEKEVFANEDNENNNINDGGNNQNIIETHSDTYEEVAVANIESRMAWSDKATPSVHSQVLSPISSHGNLEDTQITNLVDNADDLNDNELMKAVHQTFAEDLSLTSDLNQQSSSKVLPDINIDSSSSSDNSMNQYFTKPEVAQEDVKPSYTFSDMLDSIRSRRDDSNIISSPQVSQLGLSPRLTPLNTKPSISNLLDDTMDLFEDEDDVGQSISNIDKGKGREINENLLSTVSEGWENVQTNIHYGDNPNNIVVNLDYGSLWTRISKYRFIMNNDQVIDYDYVSTGDIRSRSFDLTSKIQGNTTENVDIKEIQLLDLNYNNHSIWKNTNIFD